MGRQSIAEYAAAVVPRYRAGGRQEKGRVLAEFCAITGYHRKAAIRLLHRLAAATPAADGPREPVVARVERRGRPARYGPAVVQALKTVWEALDQPAAKRLAPFLPEIVPILERHRAFAAAPLSPAVRDQVVALPASTIDRLLAPYRRQAGGRGRGRPPATGTLRAQVPIRTHGEWADAPLGSVQADLVEHCGDTASGFFLFTLTVVDVRTSWTSCRPVWGKTMVRVTGALGQIAQLLPMPLVALHTDNGSEFLNEHLAGYCVAHALPFTRGRPYRKNDQAFVEQRNWHVRQWVGYHRYSSKAAYDLLAQLYEYQRLYMNFFQPVQKLIAKERVGAKVRKRYDQAATPYQRLLATRQLDAATAGQLARSYQALSPIKLRAWIQETQRELVAQRERSHRVGPTIAGPDSE